MGVLLDPVHVLTLGWRYLRKRGAGTALLPSAESDRQTLARSTTQSRGGPEGVRLDLTESKIANQALAQEQALFDRNLEKDHALFRLHVVMGWATVLMVPTTVVISILIPPAAIGLVPLTGLAGWNWRRTLRRDGGELETTTKISPKG